MNGKINVSVVIKTRKNENICRMIRKYLYKNKYYYNFFLFQEKWIDIKFKLNKNET